MDSLLSNVLKEICKEYEIEESIVEPVISKLKSEFFIKLKDMKNISFELWKSFNFPSNLYYILNEKYQEANTHPLQAQQSQMNQTKPPQQTLVTWPKQPERSLLSQSQAVHSSKSTLEAIASQTSITKPSISSEDIQTCLEMLSVEIENSSVLVKVFLLIQNTLSAIVINPKEEKFKKVNIEKILSKYPYQSLKTVFDLSSFKKVDDKFVVFYGEMKNLNFVLDEITVFLNSNKIVLPDDDSMQSDQPQSNQSSQIQMTVDFDRLYQEELARRNKLILQFDVARDPKLARLSSSYTLNNVIQQMNEDKVIEYHSEEETMIKVEALNTVNSHSNDRFTVKSRAAYESLLKTPIILQSHIRFLFPDEIIVEAFFSLRESIEDIIIFVKECLLNSKDEFVLSTTPPPKKYIKMKQTIAELKLYPKVLLYVNFSNEYHKLKENIFPPKDIQVPYNPNTTFNPYDSVV